MKQRVSLSRLSLALTVATLLVGVAMLGVGLRSYLKTGGEDLGRTLPVLSADRLIDRGYQPADQASDQAADQATAPTSRTSSVIRGVSTDPPPPGSMPRRMIIDKIDVDASVSTFRLDEDRLPEVPQNGDEVAWYNFSAVPGMGSNAVFAGHVSWKKVPAVFLELQELEVGDRIRLVTDDGSEFVYAVSDMFLVDPLDPASLQVMNPTTADTITLITCGGRWVSDASKPLGGDFTHRVIVQATDVTPSGRFPIHFGF